MPPRKRKRGRNSSKQRPITFSSFSRSVAAVASCKKAKHHNEEYKSQADDLPSSSGNEYLDQEKDEVEQEKDEVEQTSSSDEEDSQGVVQSDFVFFDPKPSDFHGIKVLLQNYLDNKQWDISGFVDLILGQPTVGSVVKIDNDEDDGVYSFVTALNLQRYESCKCMIELKDYLLKVCRGKDDIAKLKSLLKEQAHDVGLVVSQRVVNLPPQLLPHLYDALFDEVQWATEDEPTEELRNYFRFKVYLIITKIYKHKNADLTGAKIRNEEETVIFLKPEDEIFLELSSWSFSFPLHSQQVTTTELKNYRSTGFVMAIEASKVPMVRKQLHSLIDEQ